MDIFNETDLRSWIADSARPAAALIALDLRSHEAALDGITLSLVTLMGCRATAATRAKVDKDGGAMISAPPGLPFDPFRSTLYAVEDLYDKYDPALGKDSWKASFDYRNYLWFMDEDEQLPLPLTTSQTVFGRLHDTAMEGAIARFITAQGRRVVGFMGGHDTPRNDPVFRTIVELARTLTRKGLLVLSGGGPGLMEAANLGAFLAPYEDAHMDAALATIEKAPTYKDDNWLSAAWAARADLLKGAKPGAGSVSLGVPTWLYGFEPPNVFATHAGKMFFNSLREDGLVTLAGAGLIIGPGNAGTVQEVFQDMTQNYYRKETVAPTPIALLGEAFWTRDPTAGPDTAKRTKPVKPLVMALAGEKPKTDFSAAILVTDDVQKIIDLILPPTPVPLETRGDLWAQRVAATCG